MATEILVNDGGAPARILPFTAGATLSGGEAVIMSADGELDPAGAAATNVTWIHVHRRNQRKQLFSYHRKGCSC
jgi:hypothetical protein